MSSLSFLFSRLLSSVRNVSGINGPSLPSLSKLSESCDLTTRKYCTLQDKKDHTYVSLGKGDLGEIIPIVMGHFVEFEAIAMGLHATYKESKDFYERYTSDHLRSNYCVGARNNEGKLIGLLLAKNEIKEDSIFGKSVILEGNKVEKLTLNILQHVGENYDVFSKHGVSEVLYQSMCMVIPGYGGHGIMGKLMEITEQKAVKKGINVAYGFATGLASQKTSQNIGYMTVYETQYKTFDFLDLKAMGDNTSIQFVIKNLE